MEHGVAGEIQRVVGMDAPVEHFTRLIVDRAVLMTPQGVLGVRRLVNALETDVTLDSVDEAGLGELIGRGVRLRNGVVEGATTQRTVRDKRRADRAAPASSPGRSGRGHAWP